MSIAVWTGVLIYAVVVAGWWLRHILLSLPGPLGLIVEPSFEAPTEPCVSIVVPARNEALRIGPCLESLLQQGPALGELIVVDDRSADGTGALVQRIAGDDARVRVLRVDTLPDGWSGKAHACHVGGRAARCDWILFTDADCRLHSGALAGAVRYAERHGAAFLTLWLRADHRSFWEHMLIPLCGALILYWFPPFRANAAGSSIAFANGQFILIRADAYRQVGGHEAVRSAVIEDVPLAQHAKRAGVRTRAALGPQIAHVRMYTNLREIVDGWTRIFIGALQRPWKMLVSIASLLGGSLLPSVAAPLAAVWAITHGLPPSAPLRVTYVLCWLHFVATYSVSFRAWGLCRCDRRYLVLYPLSVMVVIAIFARAWWWMITDRAVVWRGSPTGRRA